MGWEVREAGRAKTHQVKPHPARLVRGAQLARRLPLLEVAARGVRHLEEERVGGARFDPSDGAQAHDRLVPGLAEDVELAADLHGVAHGKGLEHDRLPVQDRPLAPPRGVLLAQRLDRVVLVEAALLEAVQQLLRGAVQHAKEPQAELGEVDEAVVEGRQPEPLLAALGPERRPELEEGGGGG